MRKCLWVLCLLMLSGCAHGVYVSLHKKRLLDPTMDPTKTTNFSGPFLGEPTRGVERGSGDASTSMSASCPTCGI